MLMMTTAKITPAGQPAFVKAVLALAACCCAVTAATQVQRGDSCTTLRCTSAFTAFPDAGRGKGHTYNGVHYPAALHYADSSVLVVAPNALQAGSTVDLVYWFHGWFNTIDSANNTFSLAGQFLASRRNALLVIPETARNAPDSYGGKLEQPGVFKSLTGDLLARLQQEGLLPQQCRAGQIVLAGHSGAYRVMAQIVQQGGLPVQELLLFDGLYGQVNQFLQWLRQDAGHRFVHWGTPDGGTDETVRDMIDTMEAENMAFTAVSESMADAALLRGNRIVLVFSNRGHNAIINKPDHFKLLLENSSVLQPLPD